MSKLSDLKNYFKEKKCNLIHEYPDKMTVADILGREDKFIRASYCFKCKEYRGEEVNGEFWTPRSIEKIIKNKYQVYYTLEEIFAHRNFIELKKSSMLAIEFDK